MVSSLSLTWVVMGHRVPEMSPVPEWVLDKGSSLGLGLPICLFCYTFRNGEQGHVVLLGHFCIASLTVCPLLKAQFSLKTKT